MNSKTLAKCVTNENTAAKYTNFLANGLCEILPRYIGKDLTKEKEFSKIFDEIKRKINDSYFMAWFNPEDACLKTSFCAITSDVKLGECVGNELRSVILSKPLKSDWSADEIVAKVKEIKEMEQKIELIRKELGPFKNFS